MKDVQSGDLRSVPCCEFLSLAEQQQQERRCESFKKKKKQVTVSEAHFISPRPQHRWIMSSWRLPSVVLWTPLGLVCGHWSWFCWTCLCLSWRFRTSCLMLILQPWLMFVFFGSCCCCFPRWTKTAPVQGRDVSCQRNKTWVLWSSVEDQKQISISWLTTLCRHPWNQRRICSKKFRQREDSVFWVGAEPMRWFIWLTSHSAVVSCRLVLGLLQGEGGVHLDRPGINIYKDKHNNVTRSCSHLRWDKI